MAWWDDLFGAEKRARVPVERLTFDRQNPRFTPDKHPANQTDAAIIEYLDRTADLGELTQSIASSGYVDIEPLIVMPRGHDLVVIEGNRRLAALKALLSPALAAEANVSVPDIRSNLGESLREVTAFKVDEEEEARTLIGFKHINGPQGWDAYAKALYASRWLDEQADRGTNALSLTDIAARMGDKHDTLYRIVTAVYVLQQAEGLNLFKVEDRARKNFSFSHLYTALSYSEFREFIGMGRADRSADPQRNPVAESNYPNLRRLLLWLYGSRSERVEPAVKTQAPDLSYLKRIIGHPVARRVMMERDDLVEALTYTVDGSDRFDKALVDAQAALRKASAELSNAKADEEIASISDDVRRMAIFIHRHLSTSYERADEADGEDE